MERFNAFLILSAEGAELINPIDGQPRPDPSFHHNLANPNFKKQGHVLNESHVGIMQYTCEDFLRILLSRLNFLSVDPLKSLY